MRIRFSSVWSLLVAVIAVIIAISGLVYYFFFYTPEPIPDDATFKEEFALVLKDYEGNDVALSQFKRSILVVYLWASWCPYCAQELRNLAQLKTTYGDEVIILAVNRAEPLPVAKQYTDTLADIVGLTYLLDPEDALYKDIEGYAMPETVFINEKGNVTFHQRGPIELQAVEAKIKEIVGR